MKIKLTAPPRVDATIAMPTSKSISNRALLISALCSGEFQVMHPALCDDTAVMIEALSHQDRDVIDVGEAGTAMRFLTAYFATREGSVTLDGAGRMRQRPIGVLVDALRTLGARIDYPGEQGFPPLRIHGPALHGGDIVSAPYIHMTAAVMRHMGADVDIAGNRIGIGTGYRGGDYLVEADWSAAAPWYALAALLPDSSLILQGLNADSIQGDARLVELGRKLGLETRFDSRGATVDNSHFIGCCCSAFADMTSTPDLVPSWVVLLCLLERSFRMTGVRTLRLKESDRIEALREELLKLGYVLKIESDDAISWYGERVKTAPEAPVIDPHGDHRLAMAFAPAAVRFPGLIIADAPVVSKSYPAYWRHLEQVGFEIEQLAQ